MVSKKTECVNLVWYIKTMTNYEIARLFRQVAAAYTVKKDDRFKITAYERAADAIEHATSDVFDLWEDNMLNAIPGLGKSLTSHLDELFRKGKVKHFEEIFSGLPKGMFAILDVPGLGPKTAYRLASELNVKSIDDLEKKCSEGKVRKLEGFGEVSEKDILKGIEEYKRRGFRIVLPRAYEIAQKIEDYMKKSQDVLRIDTLGSLRRMSATVGDVDFSVSTKNPEKVINHFIKYKNAERVLEKGEAKASIKLVNGLQADLRVQDPKSYGSLLQHFTGSKEHNIHLREYALSKGLSLSEYGIKKNGKLHTFTTEEEFYGYLGLEFIPPELRENTGEIEAALAHKLPKLVDLSDIKGDFHLHSDFPIEPSHDLGVSSMEDIIKKSEELGYEYIGFADHSPSVSQHTKDQIKDLIKRRSEKIEQLKYSSKKMRVYNLLEVDILADNKLSVDDENLTLLDFYIVSIHSSFNQSKEEMTKRIIEGLSHPRALILGHPTGRLLNSREGYAADWDKIFDFCLKNNRFLEINAWSTRLDLPDNLVRDAQKLGVKFAINTDSHAVWHMDNMRFGISVARRGWCPKASIINTLSVAAFDAILKQIN